MRPGFFVVTFIVAIEAASKVEQAVLSGDKALEVEFTDNGRVPQATPGTARTGSMDHVPLEVHLIASTRGTAIGWRK